MKRSKSPKNFAWYQSNRQIEDRYNAVIQEKFLVTEELVHRLGLWGELDGHSGCVNCLEWSSNGKILASGSDDVTVVLWDPFRKRKLTTIATGHTGNIFSVKFLPNCNNETIVTGAADQAVRVHDVSVGSDVIRVCTCHTNRVKRCAVDPLSPHLFWSAGEDGVVLEHDLRVPHTCPPVDAKRDTRNVLIDLCPFLGARAEAKCLAVNPVKTDEICVGANDPYARIYDRRMIRKNKTWSLDAGAVQYLVPGHLPTKLPEYKKKYRSLAATYLSFSPDGKELLVNLGGEQIYLYPLIPDCQTKVDNFIVPLLKDSMNGLKEPSSSNGYSNGLRNGSTSASVPKLYKVDFFKSMPKIRKPPAKVLLNTEAESLKTQANKAFDEKKYAKAVHLYNEALKSCPYSSVLHGNRSAALLKRAWDGDVYVALKDCQVAFFLDDNHYKALLRMARCLLELGRISEAAHCFLMFKSRFPEHVKTDIFQTLEKDIKKVFPSSELDEVHVATLLAEAATAESCSAVTAGPSGTNARGARLSTSSDSSEATAEDFRRDSSVESNANTYASPSSDSSSSEASFSPSSAKRSKQAQRPELVDQEFVHRERCIDFKDRFCGHCNTTTDIKEANFFGNFIVAGSDDGSFFIWDKSTTNIVKVLKGDDSIVNCLQPHPSTCLLATSGIESVVRLWSPMPEEHRNDRVVDDINDAAYANQKRMNSNPFEVILMNMGYRINPNDDDVSDDDNSFDVVGHGPSASSCNPS